MRYGVVFRRVGVLFLALGLALLPISVCPAGARGRAAGDIRDHWAEEHIRRWMNAGLIGGYADGGFHPDLPVTRAEFVSLVNRAFGLVESIPASFRDVSTADWYATEAAAAETAGYLPWSADEDFAPNRLVTRAEAAAMLDHILRLHTRANSEGGAVFSDVNAEPTATKDAIAQVASVKLMVGGGSVFRPSDPVTRAETVVVLDRASGLGVRTAGTFGPIEGALVTPGNVTVTAPGVVLRNLEVKGDVFLTPGIGAGEVTLENVVVHGRVLAAGCGEGSLRLEGDTRLFGGVTVFNPGQSVDIKNNSSAADSVPAIAFYTSGSYRSSSGDTQVAVPSGAVSGTGVVLDARVGLVTVDRRAASVEIAGGVAGRIAVNAPASVVVSGGTVSELDLSASASVLVSDGSVTRLNAPVTAKGSSVSISSGASLGVMTVDGAGDVVVAGRENIATLRVNGAAPSPDENPAPTNGTGADPVVSAPDPVVTPPPVVIPEPPVLSHNAYLLKLCLSVGALSPEFSAGITDYAVSVAHEVEAVTVTAIKASRYAALRLNGSYLASGAESEPIPLTVGDNRITIRVMAEAGNSRTYTVRVNRLPSSNAALTSLAVDGAPLLPDAATGMYGCDVPYEVDSVTLEVQAEDPGATASVYGKAIADPVVLPLNVGDNPVDVVVAAPDSTTKIYRLTITRAQSGNNRLTGLNVEGVTLSPAFDPETLEYSGEVPFEVEAVVVQATPEDQGAEMGSPSPPEVLLNTGGNVISISVMAPNGGERVYTVILNRHENNNANLNSLDLDGVDILSEIDPDTLSYSTEVNWQTDSVSVVAVPADPEATVTIDPSPIDAEGQLVVPLETGDNVISVAVAAADGTKKVYTISVARPPEPLSAVSITGLSSGFTTAAVVQTVVVQAPAGVVPPQMVRYQVMLTRSGAVYDQTTALDASVSYGTPSTKIALTAVDGAWQGTSNCDLPSRGVGISFLFKTKGAWMIELRALTADDRLTGTGSRTITIS